jgi:hypothetical protein
MMLTARQPWSVYSFLGLTFLAVVGSIAVAFFASGPKQSKIAQTALASDEFIASFGTTVLSAEAVQAKHAEAVGTPPLSSALEDKLVGHAPTVVGPVLPFATPNYPSSMDVPDFEKEVTPGKKLALPNLEGKRRNHADGGRRSHQEARRGNERGYKRRQASLPVLQNRH